MKSKALLLILVFWTCISYSQKSNPQWMYLAQYENITALVEDSMNIWVGTTTGLIRIDKASQQKTAYNMVNSDIPMNEIGVLFVDHQQNLWVANHEKKLVKFDGQNWMELNFSDTATNNPYEDNIVSITEDLNGNMWFGTIGLGIFKYNGQIFTRYSNYFDVVDQGTFPLTRNYSMEVDSLNDIWMGIFAGIATYHHDGSWSDLGNWNTWNGIAAGDITALKNDKNGMLWAGSTADGVVFPSLPGGEISYRDANGWHFVPDPNHYISAVKDLTFDPAGNMYAATLASGVLKYDGSQITRITYNHPVVQSLYTNAVLYDSDGHLWIGTNKGLYKMTANVINREVMPSTSFRSNDLSGVFYKKDGTMYLQYTYNVIGQFFSTRSKIFKVSGGDTVEFSSPNQKLIDFKYEDSLGNVWGNCDWQYPILKLHDTIIESIIVDTSLYDNPGQIYDLSWDETRKLFWLGTQNGLFTFNPSNEAFIKIGNFMNGPYAGQILGVYADSTGCIWVGSVMSGVAKYQNNQWITQNFSWTMFNKTIIDIVEDKNHDLWFVDPYDPCIGRFTGNAWNVYNVNNAPLSYYDISDFEFDSNNKLYLCQSNSEIRTFSGQYWDSAQVINAHLDRYVEKIFIDKNDNVFFSGNAVTVYNPNGIVLSYNEFASTTHKQSELKVFPNPVSDWMSFKDIYFDKTRTFSIYDMTGKLIMSKKLKPSVQKITKISGLNLKDGIYFVGINSDGKQKFGKIVIRN